MMKRPLLQRTLSFMTAALLLTGLIPQRAHAASSASIKKEIDALEENRE